MADNKFSEQAASLFQGMSNFITTKTVVGEPQRIGDAIIIPLVDVSCGMAAGVFSNASKENGAGGMNTKMTPAAVLIIQNGETKLVNVRNQDAFAKLIDMVPDVINHFTAESRISPEARAKAAEVFDESAD